MKKENEVTIDSRDLHYLAMTTSLSANEGSRDIFLALLIVALIMTEGVAMYIGIFASILHFASLVVSSKLHKRIICCDDYNLLHALKLINFAAIAATSTGLMLLALN